MDAAHIIRDAIEQVSQLHREVAASSTLHAALTAVKQFQARRFAGTYADLLAMPEYGKAARFFLDELYGDKDYAQRDAQFARIAGPLQTFFPAKVVDTAVSLARLHVLTEVLDHEMAVAWEKDQGSESTDVDSIRRYMHAWRTVGRAEERTQQLDAVLKVGEELEHFTRTRGLRLMLKMMHRPAMAAGLGSLQNFLESGFDTFAGMSGQGAHAKKFLEEIRQRESLWLDRLFAPDSDACEAALRDCLHLSDKQALS